MTSECFLIDTNIFILLFNNRLAEELPSGEIVCSIITEMELLSFPALTNTEETLMRKNLSSLTIYGIDHTVKEEAIRLRRVLRLKLPDAIIAATAVKYNAVLVTNDKKLQTVQGVKCKSLRLKP